MGNSPQQPINQYEREFRQILDAGTDALRAIQDNIEACPERDIICQSIVEAFEQAKYLRARQENQRRENEV